MAGRRAGLDHAGHTNLDGISDPLIATPAMHGATGKPKEYPGVEAKELYSFMLKTSTGEEELKSEEKCTLWNSTFTHANSNGDPDDRDHGNGQ